MVIDDNEELLALYESALGWNGYGAVCLPEPPVSLAPVRDAAPDAVILDLHFSGQQFEGWRFLKLLRAAPAFEHLPVVLCTAGLAEVRDTEEWLRRHDVWVLTKPFVVSDLERVLREALTSAALPVESLSLDARVPASDHDGRPSR
jgi:CheY-like chemotaxis protein